MLEWIDFDSKIVQSSTNVKDKLDKIFFYQPPFIFNSSASFCAADNMFYKYSDRRYFSVFKLFVPGQGFSFWLFCRLNNNYACGAKSLIARILIQNNTGRNSAVSVSDSFVMNVSAKCLTDIPYRTAAGYGYGILECMSLFLPL
jgi:hypothetical protein